MPRKVLARLDAEIASFNGYGLDLVGYGYSRFMGKKWNAYLLSSDRRRPVEVTDEGGKITCLILGITDTGLVYLTGKSHVQIDIDGTRTGVPLVATANRLQRPEFSIDSFNQFQLALQGQSGRLLKIRAEGIFHFMHYEAILSGWWAYNSSLRFSKPETMPTLAEIVATVDGHPQFVFRRNAELDNAYQLGGEILKENSNAIAETSTISKSLQNSAF